MWTTTTKLTLELRDIVDNGENSVDIWAFDYPSYYKGDQKKAFEQKVIDHFYYREIGQETVGRFLHMFRTRVREIMPYYIQLYESEEYMRSIEDPFATVDYTETFTQTSTDSTTGTQEGSSSGQTNVSSEAQSEDNSENKEDRERRFSNTPQGSISNLDSYMTEATKEANENTLKNTGSSSGSSEESSQGTSKLDTTEEKLGTIQHTLTKKGAMGVTTFGHDMIEYRQSFLNIDMQVINDLNCLFLGVY